VLKASFLQATECHFNEAGANSPPVHFNSAKSRQWKPKSQGKFLKRPRLKLNATERMGVIFKYFPILKINLDIEKTIKYISE